LTLDKAQIDDLEIGPEMAEVVANTVVTDKAVCVILFDEAGILVSPNYSPVSIAIIIFFFVLNSPLTCLIRVRAVPRYSFIAMFHAYFFPLSEGQCQGVK
jgi:hypothetical protein